MCNATCYNIWNYNTHSSMLRLSVFGKALSSLCFCTLFYSDLFSRIPKLPAQGYWGQCPIDYTEAGRQ